MRGCETCKIGVYFADRWQPATDKEPCESCSKDGYKNWIPKKNTATNLANKHRLTKCGKGKQMLYDDGEYIPFSKKLMKDLGIKDYAVLMDILDKDDLDGNRGCVEIKYKAISVALGSEGYGSKTMGEVVSRLRDKGFIETWRGGNHKGNAKQFYRVHHDKIKEHMDNLREERKNDNGN